MHTQKQHLQYRGMSHAGIMFFSNDDSKLNVVFVCTVHENYIVHCIVSVVKFSYSSRF